MGRTSNLELPSELKKKIERVARQRNEEPASLLSHAIDSLLSVEEAQLAEIHKRDLADPGAPYTNEEAFAKLDTFRPSRRNARPK